MSMLVTAAAARMRGGLNEFGPMTRASVQVARSRRESIAFIVPVSRGNRTGGRRGLTSTGNAVCIRMLHDPDETLRG
jgi:hypothetical protein